MNPTRADQISPLDMFKIGIGPSSSHTVGPMIAALQFRQDVANLPAWQEATLSAVGEFNNMRLEVELFGSLSATGKGHGTDGAVCAGLAGMHPKTASPEAIWNAMPSLRMNPFIDMNDRKIRFHPDQDITWKGWFLDEGPLPHPNTVRFTL